MTRREALQIIGAGFGSVGLATTLGAQDKGPLYPKPPQFTPKAKRVIYLFLNGGSVANRGRTGPRTLYLMAM